MPILLAFVSALVYGIADYCGGRATRRNPAVLVALVGQAVSLLLMGVAVAVMGDPVPRAATLIWGIAGGVTGSIGLLCLYFALANGEMTVVAPIASVVGATLPVIVGLASGERPEVVGYLGIALAVVAVALISGLLGSRASSTRPMVMGAAALAGLGFGGLFVALDRAADDAGLWPLLATRVASVPMLGALVVSAAVRARRSPGATSARPVSCAGWRHRGLGLACLAGVLDNFANVLYLLATRGGLLSIVAVVSSLYPASTIALAFVIDRERIHRAQVIGLVTAGGALVLVTLGRG